MYYKRHNTVFSVQSLFLCFFDYAVTSSNLQFVFNMRILCVCTFIAMHLTCYYEQDGALVLFIEFRPRLLIAWFLGFHIIWYRSVREIKFTVPVRPGTQVHSTGLSGNVQDLFQSMFLGHKTFIVKYLGHFRTCNTGINLHRNS